MDVRELVRKHVGPCPPEVHCAKVTAVRTQQQIEEGKPVRVPTLPLASQYMDAVCAEIRASTVTTQITRTVIMIMWAVAATVTVAVGKLDGIVLVAAVAFVFFWVKPRLATRAGIPLILATMGGSLPVLASVDDVPELKPIITKDINQGFSDRTMPGLEIVRIGRWGDDDYWVKNASSKPILNIRIFYVGKQYDRPCGQLLPWEEHTFTGIPDDWDDKVTLRFDVEEKSQMSQMLDMAKEAIDYAYKPADVLTKSKRLDNAKGSRNLLTQELIENVKAADKEEGWWSPTGMLRKHTWQKRLEQLLKGDKDAPSGLPKIIDAPPMAK